MINPNGLTEAGNLRLQVETLTSLVEGAANMMRGMTMDPAIPRHAKSAMMHKIQELEKAIEQEG